MLRFWRLWFCGGEGSICVLFVHYFKVLTSDPATISTKERLRSAEKGCERTLMDFDAGLAVIDMNIATNQDKRSQIF